MLRILITLIAILFSLLAEAKPGMDLMSAAAARRRNVGGEAPAPYMTGGTVIATNSGYYVVEYNTANDGVGACVVHNGSVTNVRIMVLAAGGSSRAVIVPGCSGPGGGGGGGMRDISGLTITEGSYTVTVGSGVLNAKGGNSSIFGYTSEGGGIGGTKNSDGGSGGSGGGGGYANSCVGGAGNAGQGYAGAACSGAIGGGGGGASEAGNTDGNGQGGDGATSDITGTSVVYGGGGGGGRGSSNGGDGGGGDGSATNTNTQGTDKLGGGGGAAGNTNGYAGKRGGHGIIYVKISTDQYQE